MKKILLVSNETSLNGAPRSLFEIAKGLKSNFQFIFLLPDKKGTLIKKLNEERFQYIVFDNIQKLYTKNYLKRLIVNIILFFEMRQFFKKGEFDIINLNTSTVRFAVLPALFSKSKVVWHIREYYKNQLKNIMIKLLCYIVADKVIVNSFFLKKKIGLKQAIVIHNGIEIKKRDAPPLPEKNRILFIGRVTREKGVDDLIKSISKIEISNRPMLDIVGSCDDIAYYKNLIKDNLLQNNIILHGFQEDIVPYIENASMLVVPSYRESFGRVILEAFAHSRPVIVTRVGGIPEIVDEKCGILISLGDIKSLTKAIVTLLNNKNLAEEMGKIGKNKVITQFSMRSYIEKVFHIYNIL